MVFALVGLVIVAVQLRSVRISRDELKFMLKVNHKSPKTRLLKVHGFYIRQTMEHFFYAVPEAAAVVRCDFILLRGYFVIRGRHFLTSCNNQAMVHSWKAIGLEQL